MGIDISKMKIEDINSFIVNKIVDYTDIMSNYLSREEIDSIIETHVKSLGQMITNYDKSRNLVKSESISEDIRKTLESSLAFKDMQDKNKILEENLNNLANDELEFVRFMSHNPFTNSFGLEYQKDDSNLYSGINKAITYSVVLVLGLNKEKNGESFELPKEMKEYNESTTLRDIQVRDIVTIDLYNIFNQDLYRMFFMGNGEEFNNKMHKVFTDEQIERMSNSVDKSIYSNDEHDFLEYEVLINEAKEYIKNNNIFEGNKNIL